MTDAVNNRRKNNMRTARLKVFKFNELTDKAKQTAIENYRNRGYDYSFYYDEITESVKAVVELFNLKTGSQYSDLRTPHIDDNILELSGARLYTYIINNYGYKLFKPSYIRTIDGEKKLSKLFVCSYFTGRDGLKFTQIFSKWRKYSDSCTLTGVCYDNDILQPVYDFLKKPTSKTNFQDLINDIESAISKAYRDVEEWTNSDEFIQDEIEANEYEFLQDGTQFYS